MRPMPSTNAPRLLLFSDGPRAAGTAPSAKVRHYRLARLQREAPARAEAQPRYEYLKRSYD